MIVIVFLIFSIFLINDISDDAHHIPEEGCSADFDEHYDDDFYVVLRGDVSIANCGDGGHRPVDGVDVLHPPGLACEVEAVHLSPGFAGLGLHL